MTIPRYQAICEHWERIPPVAVSASLIAQSLGAMKLRKSTTKAKEDDRASTRQSLMDMLGGVGFSKQKPDWLKT